jgi:hypothetical protein
MGAHFAYGNILNKDPFIRIDDRSDFLTSKSDLLIKNHFRKNHGRLIQSEDASPFSDGRPHFRRSLAQYRLPHLIGFSTKIKTSTCQEGGTMNQLKMVTASVISAAFFSLGLVSSPAFAADKTSVRITSPKSGSTVHSPVVIHYILHKGPKGDHVHLFIDGQFAEPTHQNPVKIKLPKGKHTLTLKVATAGHKILGPKSKVTINVE